ncbi:MAG: hypothetical protein MI924_06045 [Chloroflexales bacterium]|nr:hypothetical protein [Chloroflexales bacterium]
MKKKPKSSNPRYPPPEEVRRIVDRRERLQYQLIEAIKISDVAPLESAQKINALILEYGEAEVKRSWRCWQEIFDRPESEEEEAAHLYGIYFKTWQRFGGKRPLLTADELEQLQNEKAELITKVMLHGKQLTPEESRRYYELDDLTLAKPHLWEDLIPPDPPPVMRSDNKFPTPDWKPDSKDLFG